MFSGKENPRETGNVKMENLFMEVFDRKRRIVDLVRQRVDLYDQHLASKCLLAGVSPPTWLWYPSIPSQTSELNKEEIISKLLRPPSRLSIICPSSRSVLYQQPVSFLADNVVRQDLTSKVNNPLEEQLCEDDVEQQLNLPHNLVRRVSNHSCEQDANIASPRVVHEKEKLPESVSHGCRENQSYPSPEHYENKRVESSLNATSSGRSQGKMVPKSVSPAGCERKPSTPGYLQDESEPNTCLDPGLSLAKMQRSKSRQKALELRSSAKASKSRSNSRIELKPSPGGNTCPEIASFRCDGINEIKIIKRDEGCRDEVENSNSQGQGEDQCSKTRSTTESLTPHHKADWVQESSIKDDPASISRSLHESGHVSEIDTLLPIETIGEVFVNEDEQVDEPSFRGFNETTYFDGGTRSKSSGQDSLKRKRKHQKPSNSLPGDFLSRNLNPSHQADNEVELPRVLPMTNDISIGEDAETSILKSKIFAGSGSNAQGDRSKTEHSGSIKSSSIDVEPRNLISLLQGGNVKESVNPSTVDAEGLVVENISINYQIKDKGECADTNTCSSAERESQTSISLDETICLGPIHDSIFKTELLGFAESSSVDLQTSCSIVQPDEESVLLKAVTVTEALSVEVDNNGESIKISSTSKSMRLSQMKVVEPVLVESVLQESGTPENLIDHSKRCDIGSGSMEVYSQSSSTKVRIKKCHNRTSRPRSSAIEEESKNEYKAFSFGSDHKVADIQLEVRAGNSLLRSPDLPVFVKPESPILDDNEARNIAEVPVNNRGKSTMVKVPTPASATRVFDVPSLTDSEVSLLADNEMNDIEGHDGLKMEIIPEPESLASHTDLKVRKNEPLESNTYTGHIDALTKRPQHDASSDRGVSPVNRDATCTETDKLHDPESSIQEFFCSRPFMYGSQDKRRRTLETPTSRELLSSPEEDILDSDYRETEYHREEDAWNNFDNCDAELQKVIGSVSSDHFGVELQKMIGSASSTELRFEESYLFKEAGLMSPASLSYRPEQLSVQRSQNSLVHAVGSENINFVPYAKETSHPLASCIVRNSDGSPCLPPLGSISSDNGSPPLLEGFLIQTDDENHSDFKNNIKHDSFQLPRTTAESAAMIEQICKSACMTTPSLHLAKTFKFDGKLDLNQSVSDELFDCMFFSQNLEGSSVFDNLGIHHDYTGRSHTNSLPLSVACSSAEARNPCTSPTEKLWYTSLQKSSGSEKRSSQTPDLPCINEEIENVEEEAENLCVNTPKSVKSEKRGSLVLDLPCITEENENIDEISEAVNEASGSGRENVSAERKPLGDINEHPIKFLPSISEAKIPVDRQSLDSVSTAFSFSAKCNSGKSKVGKQNNRRFTGKGKENQGGAGGKRNFKPPSSRFSKPKLSCNSSSTTVGPRLPEKELRHNNIVSNITSFVPLVQQQKPASALITGKRDVKVKALEAAEASKRIAEQKENDRKMKKEAMKLERARQEQENLRKQEMEKKKKEEGRKKKEAEMAWKQEMEKKKKEEERKRKEFEMADRKRQREEEDKKLKEAKRQRIAEIQRQQREAEQKLQAEKELKRQAMDARTKVQKESKEAQGNAEKTRGQANTRIHEVKTKSNSSDDTNASRSSRDDFKVISDTGKVSEKAITEIEKMEESYDISPYKCSDDEDDEEDNNEDVLNKKFIPTWASKDNILLGVTSQQNLDPKIIFPRKSICYISEVLLPRKFQSR